MTKDELIAELEYFDGDQEIYFCYDYGDHWRTEVAAKVTTVSEGHVERSDYHQMDRVLPEYNDDGDPEDNDGNPVILLNASEAGF